jgi:hypothetical protein
VGQERKRHFARGQECLLDWFLTFLVPNENEAPRADFLEQALLSRRLRLAPRPCLRRFHLLRLRLAYLLTNACCTLHPVRPFIHILRDLIELAV